MANIEFARKVVGICGNVISFLLFLSPVPTFVKIAKKKDVEDFSPIPYLVTLMNCAMWIFYGLPLVTSNNMLVWTINGTGFLLESIYIIVFFAYSPSKLRLKVLKILAIETVFMAAVVASVIAAVHTHKKRTLVVGILALIFNLGMYAAPFSAIKLVIQTKSVEYMPFPLSLMSFLNGLCWMAYSFLRLDIFILIPNGMGVLLALVQLALYLFYYNKGAKQQPPKPEVQMACGAPSAGVEGFPDAA